LGIKQPQRGMRYALPTETESLGFDFGQRAAGMVSIF
jgi:hypothetical protein